MAWIVGIATSVFGALIVGPLKGLWRLLFGRRAEPSSAVAKDASVAAGKEISAGQDLITAQSVVIQNIHIDEVKHFALEDRSQLAAATRDQPPSATDHDAKGFRLLDEGKPHEAIKEFWCAFHEARNDDLRTLLLLSIAFAHQDVGDHELQEAYSWVARDLAEVSALPQRKAQALRALTMVYLQQHESHKLARVAIEAVQVHRGLGDDRHVAESLYHLSLAYGQQNAHAEAGKHSQQSLALFQALHDEAGQLNSLTVLAGALVAQGRYADAEPKLLEARDLARRLEAHQDEVFAHLGLAVSSGVQGHFEAARNFLMEAKRASAKASNAELETLVEKGVRWLEREVHKRSTPVQDDPPHDRRP